MKTFLQNLLIFLSLCLCALISFQWVRETALRKDVQDLNNSLHDKMENIQNLQATVRRDTQEIERLDGEKKELTATLNSNNVVMADLTHELRRATNQLEVVKADVQRFKNALEAANYNLKVANTNILEANDRLTKFAEQHNEVVLKYNTLASNYTSLVEKWNKQQDELQRAATNAPPPPKK